MIEIRNVEYTEPFKILKFEVVSGTYRDVCSYEIAPARIENNRWVLTSPQDYHLQEVRDLIEQSFGNVWNKDVVDEYKKSREGELVLSYNETTLSNEELAEILKMVGITPEDIGI